MSTKISMKRIFFMLYIGVLILISGIPNINIVLILVFLLISILLYKSKKFTYTLIGFYIESILVIIFLGVKMNIPNTPTGYQLSSYEISASMLPIIPYLLIGIIILILLINKDFIDGINKKKRN